MTLTTAQQDKLQSCMDKLEDELQIQKCIEELAELIQAIARYNIKITPANFENVIEEIADVYIMMYQIKDIFGITEKQISEMAQKKIDRLYNRCYGGKHE